MRPWVAAAYWRLLIAVQLPKDTAYSHRSITERVSMDLRVSTLVACTMKCRTLGDLGNTSELQVGVRIIPDITDLNALLVMSNRLREPIIKASQEATKVSWDRMRKGSVEDENVPLPAEELKRLESLCFNRHKLRVPAGGDIGEIVVNRLKRQLNKYCIWFENILKTKTRKGGTAGTRSKRTGLGDRSELVNNEPEQKQSKTLTAEVYLDALWAYILGLARAGIEEAQDKPIAAESDGSQIHYYAQIPLDVTTNYHSRAKRFTTSLPKNRALAIVKRSKEQAG